MAIGAAGTTPNCSVDQARNDAASLKVDASRAGASQAHDVLLGPHCNETIAADRHRLGLRVLSIEGRDPAIEQNEVHGSLLGSGRCSTEPGGKCAEAGHHATPVRIVDHDQVPFAEMGSDRWFGKRLRNGQVHAA